MLKQLLKYFSHSEKRDYTYFDSLVDIYGEDTAKRMMASMKRKLERKEIGKINS